MQTMKIGVKNYRGAQLADLTCSPIALLCGRNEQGKSSILDGVRAVLDGTAQPYGLTKEQLGAELVFKGQQGATVSLEIEERLMGMAWPAGEMVTSGAPVRATPFATGSKKFTDLVARERSQVLARYLKTDPTVEEYAAALKDSGLSDEIIEQAWKDVGTLGWDSAWEKHRLDTTKLKGGWETITGASYGIKVGGNWRPKGWGPDHESLTDEEMAADLKQATDDLEAAIGKVAITGDEKKRLESLVTHIPKLKELQETRVKEGTRAAATLKKAVEALQAIPELPSTEWPTCPHCQKAVQVRAAKGGGSVLVIPPKAIDAAERKKIKDAVEAAERVVQNASNADEEARNAYLVVKGDLQKSEDAKAQLESAGETGEKIDIDELRTEQKRCVSIIDAKRKIRDAVKKHGEVIARLELVKALSPEGLRHAKLIEKLDEFNAKLKELCEVAEWGDVRIGQAGDVSLNGVRYALCARSGQMRCDVTIQVAFAQLDGSEVLIVDDADMLDGKGRNGLFTLLRSTDLYCLVAMMLTKIVQAPDLSASDYGATWWVDEAEAHPLSEYQKAAAE